MAEQPKRREFHVTSLFGRDTRQPYVQVSLDGERLAQLSPEQARHLGQSFFEAAEAAEGDALVYQLMAGMDLGDDAALAMLQQMRKLREARRMVRGDEGAASDG